MKRRRKKKKKTLISVPVASMGDIAFLLIIFFMVASRLITERNLMPPQSLDAAKLKESKIAVSIDADGIIFLNGREVPDAEAIEWGVRALIEGKKDDIGKTVMFNCDRALTKNVFEPVIEAIARGGGLIAAVGDQATDDSIALTPPSTSAAPPAPGNAADLRQ